MKKIILSLCLIFIFPQALAQTDLEEVSPDVVCKETAISYDSLVSKIYEHVRGYPSDWYFHRFGCDETVLVDLCRQFALMSLQTLNDILVRGKGSCCDHQYGQYDMALISQDNRLHEERYANCLNRVIERNIEIAKQRAIDNIDSAAYEINKKIISTTVIVSSILTAISIYLYYDARRIRYITDGALSELGF